MPTEFSTAPESAGEINFDHIPAFDPAGVQDSMPMDVGPLKYLGRSLIKLIKDIPGAFSNKKKLVLTILMFLIWLVLTVLPGFKINLPGSNILNFLTCAQTGLNNGIAGFIGGTIGKGIWAYFIFSLLMPIISGQKPLRGFGGGLKTLLSSFKGNNKRMFALLLLGISLALISYNFLTGQASLQNSMVGIAAFFVSVRAMSNKAGFLRGLAASFMRGKTPGILPDINMIYRLLAGWAWGFALAVILSATNFHIIAYIFGAIILLVALIMYKKSSSGQEVA